MNKETENKELEPILKKLSDMEEALRELKQYIDNCVVPVLGARIDNLMQILNNETKAYVFEQQQSSRGYFMEAIRFAIFFAAISALLSSFLGGVASVVMAMDKSNSLSWLSWVAFGVASLLFVVALYFACKFLPESIKFWWRRSRIRRTINWFVRGGKRILRIVKRA